MNIRHKFLCSLIVVACPFLHAQEPTGDLAGEGKKINQDMSVFPPEFPLAGKTYAFDQTLLMRHLSGSVSILKKPGYVPTEFLKRKIAYQIIGAGMYAAATPELTSLLDEAEELLKAEKVPADVESPLRALVSVASESFHDKDGGVIPIEAGENNPLADFKTLILFTRMELAARSKPN